VMLSEDALQELFSFMNPHLDEKQRRLLVGSMAKAPGRGGGGPGVGDELQHGDRGQEGRRG